MEKNKKYCIKEKQANTAGGERSPLSSAWKHLLGNRPAFVLDGEWSQQAPSSWKHKRRRDGKKHVRRVTIQRRRRSRKEDDICTLCHKGVTIERNPNRSILL